MFEPGEGAGFAALVGGNLQGDVAAEGNLPGQINAGKGAGAEQRHTIS